MRHRSKHTRAAAISLLPFLVLTSGCDLDPVKLGAVERVGTCSILLSPERYEDKTVLLQDALYTHEGVFALRRKCPENGGTVITMPFSGCPNVSRTNPPGGVAFVLTIRAKVIRNTHNGWELRGKKCGTGFVV